jgi:uncharacterized OsmC-like protein
MAEKATGIVNGINTDALREVIGAVAADPPKGAVTFRVTTTWKGQTRMETKVKSYELGGQVIERPHTIVIDEPIELLGQNQAPNPQEVLMAAFNSCIMVGYTVGAAMRGIKLEKLEVETEGDLDLRGFLGIDAAVRAGYDTIHYTVRIKGNGTQEQFQEIHETVIATSPNYYNVNRPITLAPKLVVE